MENFDKPVQGDDEESDIEPVMDSGDFLPEAGGVAWSDVYLPSKAHGVFFKVSLTARAADPKTALDQLVEVIKYGQTVYGLQVVPRMPQNKPAQSAPRIEDGSSLTE
jgi:hypothetical protein